MSKYKGAKFENSLKLIQPALEWAEKQNVERLSKFLLESANVPLYCFSSGGPSSADDYLALLYETNQGMAKSLTPLMMTSISDEALRNAKIVITAGSGTGEDEKYTIARAAAVNPSGVCGITRGNSPQNIIVKTLNGVTNNWFKYNSPMIKGFISSNSTIAMFGLFYKAFTKDEHFASKLDYDLSPNHCFTYGARIEGAIPQINEVKNFIVLYSGWSRPVAQDFEAKMVECGFASVQMCDYRNFCHGRFIFLSKHLEDSALVLFLSPREKDFAERLFNGKTYRGDNDVFPQNTAIITVETKLDSPLASIDLLIKMQVLFNEIAKAFGDEPCNPENPNGIDKRYPRSLEWGEMGKMGALSGNLKGSKGTLKGVSRKKVIKYDPSKSIEEIAKENGVQVPTILKYIRDMHIDRNRDEHMNNYNSVWKVYINDSDIFINALAKKVKMSENTVKYYLKKDANDFMPKAGKTGLVEEHPKVKELREEVQQLAERFKAFREIYDRQPTLTAIEILKKAHWSEDKKGENLNMVTHFMQMKEFKYRFKNKKIEYIHNEDAYLHQAKKRPKDSLEGVKEELRKKFKRIKIKSLAELYKQRDAILTKEKERVAQCSVNYAKAKPLTWDDFAFRKTHTYDTTEVDCWSFNNNTDVRNGISLDVGNMSNGFGVTILGIDFKNSEVPYQLSIFKSDEASVAVQKEIADPSNPFFSNGLGMKRNYIYNKKYEPYRRDRDFELGNELWCFEWMKYVVWEKVKQNKGFRDILLKIPQNAMIIEQAQKKDHLMWGCWNEELTNERKILKLSCAIENDISYNSPKVKNAIYQVNCVSKWVGENAMGQILTMAKLALNQDVQMPIDTKMLNDAKICWFGDVLVFTKQQDGSVTVDNVKI